MNGEDPDAVVRVGQIALEYRTALSRSDVVIDLIGYRRHGHSEVDDPTITQPLLYAKIKDHPPLWQIYAKQIGADPAATVTAVRNELDEAHKAASEMQKKPRLRKLPATGRRTNAAATKRLRSGYGSRARATREVSRR